MRKLAAIAVTAVLAVTVAGCSAGGGNKVNADIAFTPTTPAASGDIDVVNWGVAGSEPTTLDWIYDWDYGPSNLIVTNLCEGLTRQNPDGTTTPALAASVATPDDTTYIYTLRDDVVFTDGTPMTAEDVAYSLNRHIAAAPPSYWGLWYANVQSIQVTGDNEVTVKLTAPDALFPTLMSTPAGYVGEKAFIEAAGSNYGTAAGGVMCTGPYSLASWDKGKNITLEANDKYWDKSLQPKAAKFVFSFIPDPAALNTALLTGDIDGAWNLNLDSMKPLLSAKSGDLYMNEGSEVVTIQFNQIAQGPLADIRLRQALRDLIDYDGITKGLLSGFAQPAKSTTPAAVWGYSKPIFDAGSAALAGGAQDLENAKALIAEAGTPTKPIQVIANADDASVVSALTSIQNSAKQVGLDLEIRTLPANEFTNFYYDPDARTGVDAYISVVAADIADPLELDYQVIPGSPYNFTGVQDPEWTTDLQAAFAATDDDARATATVQAEKFVNDNVYALPVYSINSRVFLGSRVTGVPVNTLAQWYYPWAATVGAR